MLDLSKEKICCYYAWFDSPTGRNKFCCGGEAFMSIEEAVANIKKENYFLKWREGVSFEEYKKRELSGG